MVTKAQDPVRDDPESLAERGRELVSASAEIPSATCRLSPPW